MLSKQKLFIYERKEIFVLILIGLCAIGFFFTLGIHLGKRVKPLTHAALGVKIAPIETVAEELPSTQELIQQTQKSEQFLRNSALDELHNEVIATGLHMDQPEIVDLPSKPLSKNAGAISSSEAKRFITWVGNFPTELDAQAFLKQAGEAHSFWKNVGKHVEAYLGPFSNEPDATEAGERLRASQLTSSFRVTRMK